MDAYGSSCFESTCFRYLAQRSAVSSQDLDSIRLRSAVSSQDLDSIRLSSLLRSAVSSQDLDGIRLSFRLPGVLTHFSPFEPFCRIYASRMLYAFLHQRIVPTAIICWPCCLHVSMPDTS
jgi:hypothetical protein